MDKKVVLIAILLLILIGGFSFLYFNLFNQEITGEVVIDSYSYTKAICNETNYCQDYEIVCGDGKVVDKNPLTGAVIQHSFDWKDPRDNETIERLC